MLEMLLHERLTQDVHRFANVVHLSVLAKKKGLTIDEITDVILFERDDVTKELMEGPFRRKPSLSNKFGAPSRFSDGDWPVFYAALGRETAGKETAHHYGRKAAGDKGIRPVHYLIVRCRFSGTIVDLRPNLNDWPDLVSEDYAFCTDLGKEASLDGLGGFLAPSARHQGGTTVSAFLPETIREPVIEATATLTFDARITRVEIEELP